MKTIKYADLAPAQKKVIYDHYKHIPFLLPYCFLLVDGEVRIINDKRIGDILKSYMADAVSMVIIEVHHTDFYQGKEVTTA